MSVLLLEYHTKSMFINEDEKGAREKVATALTVAGSDSGGCAGIQADLRTFSALGVHGMTAITGITAQNTVRVIDSFNIPPRLVASQIDAVLTDIGAGAVKTGMLPDPAAISLAAGKFREYGIENLVVDPVMVSTGGDRLIAHEALEALVGEIFPLALIVTPNLDEAGSLVGRELRSERELREAAGEILAMGPRSVLLKGGHWEDSPQVVDLFFDGREFIKFSAPRVDTKNTHGSGCTLAAAITAYLAKDYDLHKAVEKAKKYVSGAIENSYSLGKGNGPLNHFFAGQLNF